MLKPDQLIHDQLYRQTRRRPGLPNTYYKVLDPGQVKRLRKRLDKKHPLARTTPEQTAMRALLSGFIMIEAWSRWTSESGKKVETRKVFGLDPNTEVRLRAVKSKPGYVITKAAA